MALAQMTKRLPKKPDRRFPWKVAAAILVSVIVFVLWFLFNGSNDAPIQSSQRPYSLPLYQPVQRSGSDFNAWFFNRFMLPSIITLANKEYSHSSVAANFAKLALDPAKLKLMEESKVRVYFIGEGTGYVNTLGINLKGLGAKEGDPRLLFPHAKTAVQLDRSAQWMSGIVGRWFPFWMGRRAEDKPLRPGDFVDLGKLPAGTKLNFFLVANSGNGLNTYSIYKETNPDDIDHMVATAIENTSYLLVSFEDMFGGGDADYEDCVFAVEMSMDNVAALVGRFDPWRRIKQIIKWSIILSLIIGIPTGVVLFRRWKRWKMINAACKAAEEALRSGRPGETDEIVRKVLPYAGRKMHIILSGLRVAALEKTCNVAELTALYDETPKAVQGSETASLLVGRAQIEADRFDAYEALRADWRTRETHTGEWLILEAEAMVRQDKARNAQALLAEHTFSDASEALRLAHLSLLQGDVSRSQTLMAQAAKMAPQHPEVLRCQALWYEARSQHDIAQKAWEAVRRAAPDNPFYKDGHAEFYRRRGRYKEALQVWSSALAPPTLDILWLKTLFWSRVALPATAVPAVLPSPPGELKPLIEYMRNLPPEQFWDPAGFETMAQEHVTFHARQEVFWLRLLHALHTRKEAEALALVNLSGFAMRSWHPVLERSLVWILTCRRIGNLGAANICSIPCASAYPAFFEMLDKVAEGNLTDVPAWVTAVLEGPNAFAAVFAAAGWKEASKRLSQPGAWPPGVPENIRLF